MKLQLNVFLTIILTMVLWTLVIFGQGTEITIIHVNDSHSHLDGTGPRDQNLNPTLGGISRAAAVMLTLKSTEPNPVMIHSGDFCVGDFFFNKYFGVPEIQILKNIGLDAMTVGNHEFDLGPSTLEMIYYEGFINGSFPVVSANLNLSGYPSLTNFISPYTIKTVSGVKVGIFGMTIPAPLSNPDPVIISDSIPEITYRTVAELQSLGADVIICISHLGYSIDSSIAANIPGINVIAGAHDHNVFIQPKKVINPMGDTTFIVQAGSFYKYVGKMSLNYNNGNVRMSNYELIEINSQITPIPDIENIINDLKTGIIAQYGDVYGTLVARANCDLNPVPNCNNHGWKDSPLGNFITDAYRNATETKIGISANGLIADKLYHGPLVGADFFRAVGYGFDTNTGLGFNLYTCDIRGAELIKGLESSLAMVELDDDFNLQVSGMNYKYDISKPPGERVILSSVRINGKLPVMHKKYSVTMNEGLLGILLSMGIQAEKIEFTGISEYAALINFAGRLGNINYRTEGRIKEQLITDFHLDINSVNAGTYSLNNNYPNPFNPVTRIGFRIPEQGQVKLIIYDLLGRAVQTLVNDNLKQGYYEVEWNASNYSSGVYFYRLAAGNFTQTKKMILLK